MLLTQVRDREGAMQDLDSHGLAYKRRRLTAMMQGAATAPAVGMLLFSCNGRGTSLYHEASYDTKALARYIPVPASGFMCNGGWRFG